MVNGVLISFLPALLLPVLGDLGFQSTTFGDSDFGVIGIALGVLSQQITSTILFALAILLILAAFFFLGWKTRKEPSKS